ncbi:GNAT family N-acetyltransferase [Brevibacillus migulae]|uniref:GNAT family N-acetyltransferase n=1 Tax=Brevibacillus migulae TaxID=1644114 RepID=UPI00106F0780|nr:GNAT family N-acetyltransferase [Brevibacillus migulae]
MNVVNATRADIDGWLELAAEVEYLFGPMVEDPQFIQALEKNIERKTAFCVREHDGLPGSRLLGGVFFSATHAPLYKIGWLAVSSKARNKGVATALVGHLLQLVAVPAEVSMITFGEDVADGRAARNFYQRLGFIPVEQSIPNGPEGGSRQIFKLMMTNK